MLGGVVVLAAFLWSYWPTILDLMYAWKRSDEYSSGMLVPPLALYVVWLRRQEIGSTALARRCSGGSSRLFWPRRSRAGDCTSCIQSAERLSLILTIVALVLLILGWRYLARLTPILLFLCLMLPWPNRVQSGLALPLAAVGHGLRRLLPGACGLGCRAGRQRHPHRGHQRRRGGSVQRPADDHGVLRDQRIGRAADAADHGGRN